MYISKISKFLNQYKNIKKKEFINILKWWNTVWFDDYKLEKDFILTMILIKFWETYLDLIFKGWTCLNKIYFPYFRLSEDLDFVLDIDISRDNRKKVLKDYENNFIMDLWLLWFKLKEERTKFDEHKLATFTFEYSSIIDKSIQTVKIDISMKNKLQLESVQWEIKSTYINKILEENIFGQHFIKCMNLKEMLAEKIRASLTRTNPAIRDLFDIWYIKEYSDFNFTDEDFLKLVDIKLSEVNYKYTLEESYELLKKQVETDLKPVLNKDFLFDFDYSFKFVLEFMR